MRLYWAPAGDDSIITYQLRQRLGDAAFSLWSDIAVTDTDPAHEVTGLTNDSTYTFEVRAVSDAGFGAAASATATPQPDATAPARMSNVSHVVSDVVDGLGGKVTFAWDDPGDTSITGYQYRYDTSSNDPESWAQGWTDISDSATATTFELPVPDGASVFFFELRAVNNNDSLVGEAWAEEVAQVGASPAPPGAPATLTAAWVIGSDEGTLGWPDQSGNAAITGFQYRQSTNGGRSFSGWMDMTGTDSSTGGYMVGGLTRATPYTFELRAVAGTGTAADPYIFGAEAQSTPITPGGAPAPVLTVTEGLSGASTDRFDLSWTSGGVVSGVTATGFQYRYRASGGAWIDWQDIPGSDNSTTTCSLTGLAANTSYDVQVRARAGTIPGYVSNTETGTTAALAGVPAAPTGLTAAPAGSGKVTLAWIPPTVGVVGPDSTILGYLYRQSTDGGNTFTEHRVEVDTGITTSLTRYAVTGLTNGTPHTFELKAENAQGISGDWSNSAAATPKPPPPPTTPPPSNALPEAVGSISTQTVTEGGSALYIPLADKFHDPDGDALSYTVESSNTHVVEVSVSHSALTLTPVGAGAATITVTATDGEGSVEIMIARLYAKFRGSNGCHHVGTPPLMAGVGGFFTIRCQR